MSQYTIQIYGKVADRHGKADWEANRLCAECYRAEQAAKRAAAAESARAAGLPALAGGEKQIAWAESIRKVAADGVADFRTRIIGAMVLDRQLPGTGRPPGAWQRQEGVFPPKTDMAAHRASDCRAFGNLPPLPDTPSEATEVGQRLGDGLWPGEWSVWVTTRDSDGVVRAITICRRDHSEAHLVQLLVQGIHRDSIRKLMRGGRP